MSKENTIGVTTSSGQLGSAIVQATVEVVGKDCVIGLARTPAKAESLALRGTLAGQLGILLTSTEFVVAGDLQIVAFNFEHRQDSQ